MLFNASIMYHQHILSRAQNIFMKVSKLKTYLCRFLGLETWEHLLQLCLFSLLELAAWVYFWVEVYDEILSI